MPIENVRGRLIPTQGDVDAVLARFPLGVRVFFEDRIGTVVRISVRDWPIKVRVHLDGWAYGVTEGFHPDVLRRVNKPAKASSAKQEGTDAC